MARKQTIIGPILKPVLNALAAFMLALVSVGMAPAAAQDVSWIQAGPTGNGAGTNTYDREFIRERESDPRGLKSPTTYFRSDEGGAGCRRASAGSPLFFVAAPWGVDGLEQWDRASAFPS